MALTTRQCTLLGLLGLAVSVGFIVPLLSGAHVVPSLVINDQTDLNVLSLRETMIMTKNHDPVVKTRSPIPVRDTWIPPETFSACLLNFDENYRLSEWLAYHYQVLSLRYVVVAVDSAAKTSPWAIFERWKDRMTFVVWNDSDFINDPSQVQRNPKDDFEEAKWKFVERQTQFYLACSKHLKAQNQSWTAYTDVDEYIVINRDVASNKSQVDFLMEQPGSIVSMLNEYKRFPKNKAHEITHGIVEKGPESWYNHLSKACISIPRALYSAVESDNSQIIQHVPSIFKVDQIRRLETLRWRHRATKRGTRRGLGKSIIDLSRVDESSDYKEGGGPHRPIQRICPFAYGEYNYIPLGIHHYLGSWEIFSYKDDVRNSFKRSKDWWMKKATQNVSGGPDDEARPWLNGFVKLVGEDAALYLLEGAGLPESSEDN